MLTYFVNIHAHSSIKHTLRNSRVTGIIANKNEETTYYFFSLLLKRKDKNFVVLEILPKGNFLS